MRFKLVIFDLDNTLVKTRPAAKTGYKQAIYYLARMHGLEKNKDKLYNHWKRIVSELIGEKQPDKRRFAYSLKILLDQHHLPLTHYQAALHLYETELLQALTPVKGARELLSSLNESQIKITVTTGSEKSEAVKKLKAVDLLKYVDLLITSSDIGSMKPHPDYYRLPLSEYKVSAVQAVVLGDSRQEDIGPASRLGLTTYLVSPQTNLVAFKSKII